MLLQIVSKENSCGFHFPLCCTRTHYISTGCAGGNFHADTCWRVFWPNVCLFREHIQRVHKKNKANSFLA